MAIDWVLYAKAASNVVFNKENRKKTLGCLGIFLACILAVGIFVVLLAAIWYYLFGSNQFYFPIPDRQNPSSNYGPREPITMPIPGQGYNNYVTGDQHFGTDFAAPTGTIIFACAGGEVIGTENNEDVKALDGAGRYVIIQHADKSITKYFHCDTVLVEVGDVVAPFQPIATVGSTGASTGAHLHLEIWLQGTDVIDAMAVLQPWPESEFEAREQEVSASFLYGLFLDRGQRMGVF